MTMSHLQSLIPGKWMCDVNMTIQSCEFITYAQNRNSAKNIAHSIPCERTKIVNSWEIAQNICNKNRI